MANNGKITVTDIYTELMGEFHRSVTITDPAVVAELRSALGVAAARREAASAALEAVLDRINSRIPRA